MIRRLLLSVVRFVFDWRTGLTVAATALVALTIVVVVTDAHTTQSALATRDSSAALASRRIDRLNDEIVDLTSQAFRNGELIGRLVDEVDALQEQVRQLGGKPVVAFGPTTTSSTRPPSATTSSTTSTTRPTTTTTTAPCPVNVAGRCIGRKP